MRESALESDEIVRTMLQNQETLDFADQRIQELLKEGVNLEQELQIEQLSKQVLVYSQDLQQITEQNARLQGDLHKLNKESQTFKHDV